MRLKTRNSKLLLNSLPVTYKKNSTSDFHEFFLLEELIKKKYDSSEQFKDSDNEWDVKSWTITSCDQIFPFVNKLKQKKYAEY